MSLLRSAPVATRKVKRSARSCVIDVCAMLLSGEMLAKVKVERSVMCIQLRKRLEGFLPYGQTLVFGDPRLMEEASTLDQCCLSHCEEILVVKVEDFRSVCELLLEGYQARDLKRRGCSVHALISELAKDHLHPYDSFMSRKEHPTGIFTASELKEAGYSAADLRSFHYSAREARGAGFSESALAAASYTCELLMAKVSQALCSIRKLVEDAGCTVRHVGQAACVNALLDLLHDVALTWVDIDPIYEPLDSCYEIEQISRCFDIHGLVCALDNLIDARFGVDDLCDAASVLKAGGCDATAARGAGYTARELLEGTGNMFTIDELASAGYLLHDLVDADFTIDDLTKAGYTIDALVGVGFSLHDLVNAGFAIRDLKKFGYTVYALVGVGFSLHDLVDEFTIDDLKKAGSAVCELVSVGYSLHELLDADFTIDDLNGASYTADDLMMVGISAATLRKRGCSAHELACYATADLIGSGFTVDDLVEAGRTVAVIDAGLLKLDGYSVADLLSSGFEHEALFEAGFDMRHADHSTYGSCGSPELFVQQKWRQLRRLRDLQRKTRRYVNIEKRRRQIRATALERHVSRISVQQRRSNRGVRHQQFDLQACRHDLEPQGNDARPADLDDEADHWVEYQCLLAADARSG